MIPIDHDLHVHTYLSSCCGDKENQRPDKILAQAESMGLATLGFTDHIWTNPHAESGEWYRPQGEGQISRLRQDLAAVSSSVRVLVGCEADTASPGVFSITPDFAASLDYVALSCSHFHIRGSVQPPADDTPHTVGRHLMAFFRSAVSSGLATVIVHPFLPLGYDRAYDQVIATLSDAELTDAFSEAAAQGVAIEITAVSLPGVKSPSTATAWSIETPLRVLSLAKAAGCKFTFGSDSHALDHMARLRKLDVYVKHLELSEADLAPIVRPR